MNRLLVWLFSLCIGLVGGAAQAADKPDFLVDADWLAERSKDPKLVVLEVRYHPHRHNTVGHIPGALNIVSLQGADGQSQLWKSLSELAALYKDVPKDNTIITYRHDGFRSTLAWLQLKALGYQDVRVYNGGWADWDRTLTLPIVKGNKPFDADFEL